MELLSQFMFALHHSAEQLSMSIRVYQPPSSAASVRGGVEAAYQMDEYGTNRHLRCTHSSGLRSLPLFDENICTGVGAYPLSMRLHGNCIIQTTRIDKSCPLICVSPIDT